MLFSHHAWVSAIGFSEAYNEAIRKHDEWKAKKPGGTVETWRLHYEDTISSSTESMFYFTKYCQLYHDM